MAPDRTDAVMHLAPQSFQGRYLVRVLTKTSFNYTRI